MRYFVYLLALFFSVISFAQKEFHVYPIDNKLIKGSPEGDGSLKNPWDLQTALSQSSDQVNGGDIIWLHKGVYNGNYKSILQSNLKNKFITVSAFKNDKVVLNGNIENKTNYVLEVNGGGVIFKDFEVTYLGDFSRLKSDKEFKAINGVNHVEGEDCKFQNLIIHNIPGSGIGSWKTTGGSIIEDCVIYNNGYQGSRGHGVGIYIQNQTNKTRIIRNNIVFNNYYKGIEVWSATTGTNREFVKNVSLSDNIIFNNGSPSGKLRGNLIIASGDIDGVNVAKNIKVDNNVLYHNTDFNDFKNFGNGTSLTLGMIDKALVEDISIKGNLIIGKNNALNLMHIKSMEFKNNSVYTGYVHFEKSTLSGLESGNLTFNENKFYTRKLKGFRILKYKDYKLSDWESTFNINTNNEWKQLKDFEIAPILKVTELKTKPNHFNIALLEKEGRDVIVDFSDYNIKKGRSYKIYDIENRNTVLKSGKLTEDKKVSFPMTLKGFEKPLHNAIATKSVNNFNVYRIVFEEQEKKRKKGFFKSLFGWLF